MTLTRLLTAAGFAAVLAAGSAAYSQSTDTSVSVDEQGNTTTTTSTTGVVDPVTGEPVSASATTAGVPASSMTTTMAGEPGTVTTRTVTNGPVPDTAENRARYGQPLSRTGRATKPAGN